MPIKKINDPLLFELVAIKNVDALSTFLDKLYQNMQVEQHAFFEKHNPPRLRLFQLLRQKMSDIYDDDGHPYPFSISHLISIDPVAKKLNLLNHRDAYELYKNIPDINDFLSLVNSNSVFFHFMVGLP